jgi:pimeloyl-ACP methyl ester carboxylesterase
MPNHPRSSTPHLHYTTSGSGTPVVLVHGSVLNGALTFAAQAPLAERWMIVVVDRLGFGESSPAEVADFVVDARLVAGLIGEAGALFGDGRVHLVGHSYGGIVCLLAAAMAPDAVRSLTVVEPPAFGLTVGDPAADALVDSLKDHFENGPREDPEAFLREFLRRVGSSVDPPHPLPPPLAQGAAMLMVERGPWEADIPLETLAAAPFPKLVISGGHSPAFDAACDVLERELGAERAVITGLGHSVPRTGEPFNRRLEAFMSAARD